jgi:6,7-dimethyl-8-ribityllumazine synthase
LFAAAALATTRANKEKRHMAKSPGAKKQSAAKKRDPLRMLIVEARFYEAISDALLAGTTKVLDEAGATYDRIGVPGALEIPGAIAFAVDAAAKKRAPYDGVVALGCVIRGDTIHFEIVSQLSARGLMELSVARKLPIGNGILTVDTDSQAMARAKMDEGDKGGDAARAALAMVRLKRSLG